MITDLINHTPESQERLAYQYSEAPKLLATVAAFTNRTQNIEDALMDVSEIIDIDLAEGINLDIIGEVVGIRRTVPDADPLPFFGFDDTPDGQVYGDYDFSERGFRFYEQGEKAYEDWLLTDVLYRQFIRARVVRNQARGTTEDIIATLKAVFPGETIYVSDVPDDTAFYVGIGRIATPQEAIILTYPVLIPKPAGIRMSFRPYQDMIVKFGFDPTGAVYGDTNFPTRGGPIAEEIY